MIAQGFLEEVKGLLKDGFARLPRPKDLGYRELVAYLQGLRVGRRRSQKLKANRRLAKGSLPVQAIRNYLAGGRGRKGLAEAGEIIYRQVKEKIPVQANTIT